ncbi:MAG: diguanylate cyclase [Gemmatimonadetes bacterium]|nr:diguanylate cyclase [Gemmatimonadota bacterium]
MSGELDLPAVQGLVEEAVPVRALLISAGALAIPVLGATVAPEWVERDAGLLVWLAALVPAFLLTYYRGWRGTSIALAAGMATLAVGQGVLAVGDARAPSWTVIFALVVAFMTICLGIGWVGELLHRARRDAESAALIDTLTGLPNRRHLDIFLNATYAAAQRGGTLAVVVFDLDRFKAVNDRYGHAAGDEVLRAVGRVLVAETRRTDVTVRFGGEEFVTVLPGADEGAAVIFARRVRDSVRRLEFPWGRVSLSAGVARYREELASPDLLLAEADRALYAAKDQGRDRIVRASELPRTVTSAPADEPPAPGAGRADRGRVLLVEDDPSTRRSLARALERFGFEVTVAPDGRSALETLAWDLGIDVVLADVVMPIMGGLTLAERVRTERPRVRVLLLSGYPHASRSTEALPPGVSGFLHKPITLSELVTQLEAAVRETAATAEPSPAFGRL